MSKGFYTEGPIFRHVVIMTLSSAVGLLGLFFVDMADMYFLSLLGVEELAAAVGFAGSILWFTTSMSIGFAITSGALVSRSLGSEDRTSAEHFVVNCCFSAFLISAALVLVLFVGRVKLLQALGASGLTLLYASDYLAIILPTVPLFAVAMVFSGVIRATGDARGAMILTLLGAAVNAVFDPILIFAFDMGIHGAAVASVLGRSALFFYGLWKVVGLNRLFRPFEYEQWIVDLPKMAKIAVPAVLTNLSTPIGVAYITATMAQFGVSAVGGFAIITRIQPVAFVGIYALSGAIGVIAGQNLGANHFDRLKETLNSSILFVSIYSCFACGLLYFLHDPLILAFQVSNEAKVLLSEFCKIFCWAYFFNGIIFCVNATFNNIGYPVSSTVINFSKATLFTIPFVTYGAKMLGPTGILWGQFVGLGAIAIIALTYAYWVIRHVRLKYQASLLPKEAL